MKPQKINKYTFLGELFDELKSAGFVLQINDYTDVFELVKDEDDLENIKLTLAPIICTNPEQQSDFYKLFDTLKGNQKSIETKRFPFLTIFLISLFLLVITTVIYVALNPTKKITIDKNSFITTAFFHDTDSSYVQFKTAPFFKNNPTLNTKDFTFQLQIDEKLTYKGFSKTFNFDDLKRHDIAITIKSPKNEIDTILHLTHQSLPFLAFDYNTEEKSLFKETLNKSSVEIEIGDTLFVSLKTDLKYKDSTFLYNDIKKTIDNEFEDDQILIDKNEFENKEIVASGEQTKLYKCSFDKSGQYIIRGAIRKMIDVDGATKFIATPKLVVDVLPKNRLFIAASDKKINSTFSINSIWNIGCSLFSLLLILIWIWIWNKKKNTKKSNATDDDTTTEEFLGNQPPYQLQFKNKNNAIKKDVRLKNWINQLYQNINSNRYEINIEKTISKTITNFGYITPVEQQILRAKRYTVLVNKKFVKSTQFSLFNYLIENFKKNNIPFDYFVFTDFNKIFDTNNQTVSINELLERFSETTFIFFSDGYQFINYQTNDLNPLEKKAFSIIENKIIVTPTPFLDWGAEETMLQKHSPLIPADFVGLLQMIAIINNEQKFADLSTYYSKYINFFSIEEIKNYTQNDELFQWICSLAVYPKIHWELIVSMGSQLFPNQLTYSNLLKIARIKWLNEGSFPVDLRLELLNELSLSNEIRAREHILKLLETDFASVDENQFVFQEIETQKMTNSFILYANDTSKKQFQKKAENYIQHLNKGNITDTAVTQYLKNENNASHEHPLKKENYSNADEFINQYETKKQAEKTKIKFQNRLKLIAYSLLCLLPIILFFTLYVIYVIKPSDPRLQRMKFVNQTETIDKENKIYFTLNYSNCVPEESTLIFRIRKLSDTLKEVLEFKKPNLELSKRVSIEITSNSFEKDSLYTLSILNPKNKENSLFEGSFIFDPKKEYAINFICKKSDSDSIQKIPLVYIQYYPNNNRKRAVDFIEMANKLSNFNFQPIDYNGNKINGVRYFREEDKKYAVELANLATSYFGFTIEAKKSQQKLERNKFSHLELWINDTSVCKPFNNGEKYTLYFEKGKTMLTAESKAFLNKKLKNSNFSNLKINCYANSGSSSANNKILASNYGKYIKKYINDYVRMNNYELYIKSTNNYGNTTNNSSNCDDYIEIIFEENNANLTLQSTNNSNDLIVKIAEKEIGYTENPPGSNKTKYGEWFGLNGSYWSAIFISWVYNQAGKPINKGTKGFGSYAQLLNFANENKLTTYNPVAGDIYLIMYQGGFGHGGIFVRWIDDKKTEFEVIEGNSNDDGSSEGAKVIKKIKKYSSDIKFIHIE